MKTLINVKTRHKYNKTFANVEERNQRYAAECTLPDMHKPKKGWKHIKSLQSLSIKSVYLKKNLCKYK